MSDERVCRELEVLGWKVDRLRWRRLVGPGRRTRHEAAEQLDDADDGLNVAILLHVRSQRRRQVRQDGHLRAIRRWGLHQSGNCHTRARVSGTAGG